jgi:hypothetical protein
MCDAIGDTVDVQNAVDATSDMLDVTCHAIDLQVMRLM